MDILDKLTPKRPLRSTPSKSSGGEEITPISTSVQAPVNVQSDQVKTVEQIAKEQIKPREIPLYERLELINNSVNKQEKTQREKEERRRRVSAIFSGIGDGVSSLANLYYTTKGAPSTRQSSGLQKFNDEYIRTKEKREAEKERLQERMYQLAAQDDTRKHGELQQQKSWDRQDKKDAENKALADNRYNAEREYRAKRDAVGDDLRDKQLEQQDQQFSSQQNLQRERIVADRDKEAKRAKNRAYYNFVNKYGSSGSIQPVEANGTTYKVTPKFLNGYLGNMTSDILADIRDKEFGGRSEEEIMSTSAKVKYQGHKDRYKASPNLLTTLLADAEKSPRLQATIKKAEQQFQRSLTAAEGGWDIGEQDSDDSDDDFNQFIRE